MNQLPVEIWSDIACPWCHIGKRRFEAALAGFPHRAAVEVKWRAFELNPAAPRLEDPGIPYADRLARKYATSLAQAEAMIHNMTATAAAEGLDFDFERVRPGNTFDAHRLLHLAAARDAGYAAKERLLCAYLSEGAPIGDREVLARLAGEIGLDADEVRAVLAGEAYGQEVRADEDEARARGIHAVPYFLIDRRFGVSGAQSAEVLRQALDQAWAERANAAPPPDVPADGDACGPDGCP